MIQGLYPLVVILTGVFGLIRGYRLGLARQISNVLGMVFGIVCARLFYPDTFHWIETHYPGNASDISGNCMIGLLAAGGVYITVYYALSLLTSILRSALQVLSTGMLNSLAGCAFCLMKYLIFVSLAFNFIANVKPRSEIMNFMGHNDGNVVDAVMSLAPAILDFPGVEELCHSLQLQEAKKIS